MRKISERTRRRIYNKVAMRYRRKAKSLGKPKWKNIEILGKKFDEALDDAIKNYNPNEENLTSDEIIEEFKNHIQGMDTDRSSGGTPYELNPEIINALNTETNDEHEREMKQIAREFNENVEEQIKRSICPRCRSSVCRCRD
jgi:dsDNA-specific endonuclease/ATPase MutS2